MDFSIWSILESKVEVKKYNSIDSLKWALKAVWNSIEPKTVCKCCADAHRRFEAVIEADSDYFEYFFYVCFLYIYSINFYYCTLFDKETSTV